MINCCRINMRKQILLSKVEQEILLLFTFQDAFCHVQQDLDSKLESRKLKSKLEDLPLSNKQNLAGSFQ